MKHCINCGEEIADDAEVCPECGVNQSTRLETGYGDRGENQKYCVDCGALIYRQAEICPDCGAAQPTLGGGLGARDSDQVAAGLLAILLGGFGVHKFYQGNTRNGVLYLCFFWTAIPALLGLIEGILMLVADEEEYRGKWADGSILGR
jgi:TM2 domain-containing membrane protein YozV/RNA polymerase subunit RPABC4/transcription elongation factor Spt4